MHIKSLADPVQYLSGVGPKRSESFNAMGISTIESLLYFFPSKYLDRSNIITTEKLLQHVINGYEGEITIVAEVTSTDLIRYRNKQVFKVRFKDVKGNFECVWFKGHKYFKSLFKEHEYYAISGKPTLTRYGNLQFAHPDFDKFSDDESTDFISTGKIIPFYSIPQKLKSKNLGDIGLRKIIKKLVDEYAELLSETLPIHLVKNNGLQNIKTAIKNIHFPESEEALNTAKERFKYEELFYIETLVALRKYHFLEVNRGIKFSINQVIIKKFIENIPFELTNDQLTSLSEIKTDMISAKPMNRLLQGDVGSGKTIVALVSILIAVSNGYQAVIMAPTEILADQHYKTISTFLQIFKYKIELLIGGTKKSEKLIIPEDLRIALNEHEGSMQFFQSQSKSIKKQMLYWVVMAKRIETRKKRIAEIATSAVKGIRPNQFK